MKKIILTLFGLMLSIMSVYAQVAPLAGLAVVPNNAANPTVMTLTWTAYAQGTTPATGFVIERSPNNTAANFTVLTTITDLTTITYIDNVTPDSYCYRLKAVNSATPVVASAYSPIACANLATPATPTLLVGTPNPSPTAPTSIGLTWAHVGTDATTTRFLIERSSISATTGFSFLTTVTVAVPSIPANFGYVDGATTPLTPSNYYYRIRAANAFLFSPYSTVASVVIPALATPGTLTVTPNATISTSNALSWGATPNATAYDVEVSQTLTGNYVLLTSVTAPTTNYVHNMTGGNYCYRIRATVGSAVSSYNTAVCTTPIPCTSANLDQPLNVTATINIQVNTISLSWDDNSSGETGYKIWRSTSPTFTPTTTTPATYTTVIQNATGYADGLNVAINTTYYYFIAAYCGTGDPGAFSDVIAVSTTIASASEFTANIRPNEFLVDLEWLANVPNGTIAVMEDSTQIERTIDGPVPNWKFLKSVKNPGVVSPTPPGSPNGGVRARYYTIDDGSSSGMPFLPNTKYCYRVRAKKLYLSPSLLGEVFSDYSTIACATTPAIDTPTELTAIAEVIEDADFVPGSTPNIILSWKDNSIFETKYIIERKKDIATPVQVFAKWDSIITTLGQKQAGRYTDRFSVVVPQKKGLVPGTKYCYRVRAKTSGGAFSLYSNESCATAYDVSTSVDAKLSNAVKLYPNPASKNFMISFEGVNIRANKAEIINVMGQKVAEQNISSTTTEISLQNLKAGLYYVRIQSDKGTIVKKLIVEN